MVLLFPNPFLIHLTSHLGPNEGLSSIMCSKKMAKNKNKMRQG